MKSSNSIEHISDYENTLSFMKRLCNKEKN